MSIDFYWRLPSHGDPASTRDATLIRGDWTPTGEGSMAPGLRNGQLDGFSYVDHLGDIARAAEISGFVGGLIPSFPMTDDPWIISSALAEETKTFRFMIAFQPGFANPVHIAHMSSSLQRLSHGRLVFNVITGGGGPEQAWWGDQIAHDDRYARTKEFLDVLHGVWSGEPFDHRGHFYDITEGGLHPQLRGQPFPEIYFSGSSDAGIEAAGLHSDYYLSWLEPFDALKSKFDQVRRKAGSLGRQPKFAVRVDVLARDTHEEAWAEARRGFDAADLESERPWARRTTGDSVGAMRQRSFQPDQLSSADDLLLAPNIWAGFHLLRPGPAIGIVGDYAAAAERLSDLIDLGVDAFILAGVPHLEEASRVGAEVLPLIRGRSAEQRSLRFAV
ncbi:MAG: Alkanesulfonate monooxygenase [Ilumatobacteraceae bacterium]|nr:Alkanesulfonate monooxygenase [Ilumatobacteraceae bacterium]